ncbi:MAG: hypothetical protein ACOX79_06660 [Methanosarcina sp.]
MIQIYITCFRQVICFFVVFLLITFFLENTLSLVLNIIAKTDLVYDRYGKNNHALLNYKTCKLCFRETRSTIFFGLDTPQEKVLRTLATIPEKGSIREVARATGHSKDTICRWVEITGTHSKEATAYFPEILTLKK